MRKFIDKADHERIGWTGLLLLTILLLTSGVLPACGREPDRQTEEITESDSGEQNPAAGFVETESMDAAQQEIAEGVDSEDADSTEYEDEKLNEIREMFGENCIAGQTFEVNLSEYDGKVWFVPFAPRETEEEFFIQIIQDGEVLQNIRTSPIEAAERKQFTGLDAVCFGDLNYDDCTDILLIVSYGNIQFAEVYYGFEAGAEDYYHYFSSASRLNENIYLLAEEMTVSCVVELLTNGKRNGEFTSWQEAYTEAGRLYDLENRHPGEWTRDDIIRWDVEYSLVDIDGNDIPELTAGINGYYISLYTYDDGALYRLMDDWAYGAGGNSGYEYLPGENRLRNYDTDYAGMILYTTYMAVNDRHAIEVTEEIKVLNFDDSNGNGVPDGDEYDTPGGAVYLLYKDGVTYEDGMEITEEDYADSDKEAYEYLRGDMSYEDLQSLLNAGNGTN